MRKLCDRHFIYLQNLREDLAENIRHYAETGDDIDLVYNCIAEMFIVLENAPVAGASEDNIATPGIVVGEKYVYAPLDQRVAYGRFGHMVTVVEKLERSEKAPSFVIRFADGYEARVYPDELERI